jgi:hypothetical protein
VSILEATGIDADLPTAPSLLSGNPDSSPVFTETLYGLKAPFPRRRFDEHGLLLSCRQGRHKYVWREPDGSELLFDLTDDPSETRSLIGDPTVDTEETALREATRRRAGEIGVRDARSKLDAAVRALAASMELR